MKRLQKSLLVAGLLALSVGGVRAQDAPPSAPAPTAPPTADAPKPKPTDPAYDGLLAAMALLEKNDALEAGVKPKASLFDKQAAIDDPKVREALRTLNAWLNLNALPSQELTASIGELDPLTMKLFNMGPLQEALETKQYVLLADGRVADAIEATRDGLRLAVALENFSLLGCMTGFGVEDAVILPFASHLDQLAVPDCYHLMRLAEEWDKTPNAIAFALDRERRAMNVAAQKFTGEDGKKIRDSMAKIPANAFKPDSKEGIMIAQMKSLDDDGWKRLMVGLGKGIDTVFAQTTEEMKTPVYKRVAATVPPVTDDKTAVSDAPPDVVNTLLMTVTAAIKPQLQRLESEYVKRETYAHLLGCHAAIRKFHWENNRWPNTLAELKLSNLAVDPFSGNSLVYKTDKEGYMLESIGPPVYDKDAKASTTERTPITLPEKHKE